MPTTPSWEAARNGLPGDLDAVNHAAQVDQFLGSHGITPTYAGTKIISPDDQFDTFVWQGITRSNVGVGGNALDFSQPITMPIGQTTIGRISLPVQPHGDGADLLVSLWPDNAGVPDVSSGTPLASTYVPAAWFANLAAVNGIPSGGPLATAASNTMMLSGGRTVVPWAPPAGSASGVTSNAATLTSGNFTVFLGGTAGPAVGSVATAQYLGGTSYALPVLQPSIPKPVFFGMAAATADAIVYAGGTDGSVNLTNVWVAGWNPNTGTISSWSAQAALPSVVSGGTASAHSPTGTVYIVGGTDGTSSLSSVYFANVNNGQLGAWTTSGSLPKPLHSAISAVVGNWLIVAGGYAVSNANVSASTYYAAINADGSLGAWQNGPDLPTPAYAFAPGWDVASTDSAICFAAGLTAGAVNTPSFQTLTVSADGPAPQWQLSNWEITGTQPFSAFPVDNGQWTIVSPSVFFSDCSISVLSPVPYVSVPLHATGLTPGAKYHIVLQQTQPQNASDYLLYAISNDHALPLDELVSNRHSGVWSVNSATWSIPLTVYNADTTGPLLHTLEDAVNGLASRTSSIVTASASKLLLGLCEATLRPNEPLNANPTFTTGVTSWTTANCTLAQSSAQVHGGFAFSGLMTPNGTSATVSVESNRGPVSTNIGPVNAEFWHRASGWVYSPTGYSNVSLSVNWYDSANNLLSTSSNVVSVPAATWTFLNNYFVVPAGAARATLVPTEGGTPAAGNTLYLSNVTLTAAPENTGAIASVAAVDYPSGALWPPTGVTQLN